MLREIEVLGLDLGDFLDSEEGRLTREQQTALNDLLSKIHKLEDKIKERRKG